MTAKDVRVLVKKTKSDDDKARRAAQAKASRERKALRESVIRDLKSIRSYIDNTIQVKIAKRQVQDDSFIYGPHSGMRGKIICEVVAEDLMKDGFEVDFRFDPNGDEYYSLRISWAKSK